MAKFDMDIADLDLSVNAFLNIEKRGIKTARQALEHLAPITLEHRAIGKELMEEVQKI